MPPILLFRLTSTLAIAALPLLNGCVTNPATGGRQLMFVSEGQEIQMGRDADPAISAMFGLYSDSGWQRYVRGLGNGLAAKSERPQLPWEFRVVDDPIVNAFALPGGFIYVSRGILAHFDSEAQLVSVLGHEIGHVTARHSASQITQQQLAGLGLGIGMILSPEFAQYGAGIAQGVLGLVFLRFSRDDERQADMLGFRYMTRDNYDPREMPGVFAMLGRITEAAGGRGTPGWLSTHPEPDDRQERIHALITESSQNFDGMKVNRDAYLRRLDGLVYGQDPREGFFRGQRFLHPDLRFELTFPEGWQAQNQKQAVVAQSPQEDAIMQMTIAGTDDPVTAARAFVAQDGVTGGSVRSQQINGLSAATVEFSAQTEQNVLSGAATFVSYNGSTYQILGFATQQRWSRYASVVRSSAESFHRLTDQSALSVQPMRLRIVEIDRPMTFQQFVSQNPSSVSAETLAIMNQVELTTRLERGTLVKRVEGSPPQ